MDDAPTNGDAGHTGCTPVMSVLRLWWLAVAFLCLVILETVACADLGTVRATKSVEGYDVTLFTAPEPLRAGPVDVSVMVVNHKTGQALVDCQIEILMKPTFEGPASFTVLATREDAQNKLLQAALFDLPEPGQWQVTAKITGLPQINLPIELTALVDAFAELPRWRSIWLWLALPIIALVIYVFNQICVASRNKRHQRRSVGAKKGVERIAMLFFGWVPANPTIA